MNIWTLLYFISFLTRRESVGITDLHIFVRLFEMDEVYWFSDTDSGNRTWRVCPCEDSPPEREASCLNVKAGFALLAYLGARIRFWYSNVVPKDHQGIRLQWCIKVVDDLISPSFHGKQGGIELQLTWNSCFNWSSKPRLYGGGYKAFAK